MTTEMRDLLMFCGGALFGAFVAFVSVWLGLKIRKLRSHSFGPY
jgi:hypothetical protein